MNLHLAARAGLCMLLALLVTGAAWAQEVSSSHQQAARWLVEVLDLQRQITESIDVMIHLQIEQNPQIEPFEDVLRAFIARYLNMEHLGDAFATQYAAAFTEQEIHEIIAFYQTEVGGKMITLTPELMRWGADLGGQIMEEHFPELEEMILQRVAELEGEGSAQAGSVFDSYEPLAAVPLTSLVAGTWGWQEADNSCNENPHTVSFSDDEKYMTLAYEKPIMAADGNHTARIRYEVLEQGTNHLRVSMEGETQRTEEGLPVVWDLVLTSPGAYCWHQTDWDNQMCTKLVVRCE